MAAIPKTIGRTRIAAIVCAVVAKTRNERLSTIATTSAIVGTVAGFALGALVFTAQT